MATNTAINSLAAQRSLPVLSKTRSVLGMGAVLPQIQDRRFMLVGPPGAGCGRLSREIALCFEVASKHPSLLGR